MSKLDKFLKESSLSEEAKKLIQEAWEEEKASIAADIRDEMKTRYTEDYNQIVEGLNKMMNDTINEGMNDVYAEKRKLVEDRVKLRKSLGQFSEFANTVLAEEVKAMRNERKLMNEGISKFVDFSNKILAEEIQDFHKDKKALVETRVKLIAEGRQKIEEAKQSFVKRAAETASKYIEESTTRQLSELKTELVEAKQNMFGRRIFEAFANEFHSKQYNENAILRDLMESIKVKENEVLDMRVKLDESKRVEQEVQKQIRLMEDKQARAAIMNELTKPLTANQKAIMEDLLKASTTEKLAEDFKKYHKAVLNETSQKSNRQAVSTQHKSTLVESSRLVTGDRPSASVSTDDKQDSVLDADDLSFLQQISKNAGI